MFSFRSLFVDKRNLYKDFKPLVLVILDGFGIAAPSNGNAISAARKPNIDYFMANFPNTQLIASGESVGLPANEVGNSEVGHLTIGAGRVILQDLERINQSIRDGSFFDNKAFYQVSSHLTTNNSRLHLMGLVGSGNVHSSVEHLMALLDFFKRHQIKNIALHLFLDGRDSAPTDGINVVEKINKHLIDNELGVVATISGRYYAMDRDRRWERTEKTYKAMVLGQGLQASDPLVAIKSYYDAGITDEFIQPTVIFENGRPKAMVNDNDAIVFFNFRADRAIQLSLSFTHPDFEKLKAFKFGHLTGAAKQDQIATFDGTFDRVKRPKNLFFVSMTQYNKEISVNAVAFNPVSVTKTLPEILSTQGLKQLHLAESEKEKMVIYYFNGLREEPFYGEDDLIVNSAKVSTYDKKPEMSADKILSEFKNQLYKGFYRFFVINFANPDMVAHSGNIKAAIKAIEVVDKVLGEIYKEVILGFAGSVLITSDHGNAEEMQSFKEDNFFFTSEVGSINTEHSNNLVPLMLIGKNFVGKPLQSGSLVDIAPTILSIMKLPVSIEMTGKNLLI